MRIRKLTLRNFQSHTDSTITFSTGLNVIIGSSNNGKSSIVRALRCLFYNDWNKNFTTIGQKHSEIEVELEDGTRILKTKGNASKVNKISYISGDKTEEFSGFGDNVPSEIIKFIGCGPIILDEDRKFFINIANQHDQIFLLNDTGTFKSKVLGYISGIHILDSAIRDVGNDIRSSQSNQSAISQEIERLKNKISEFSSLEDRKKRRDELYVIIKEQDAIRARLNELNGLNAQIVSYNQQFANLKHKVEYIGTISEEQMHKEFVDKMTSIGICPVCGSNIEKDKLSMHNHE